VQNYYLKVSFDTATKSIKGQNIISLLVTAPVGDSLQLDLQEPMLLDSVFCNGKKLDFVKEGNVWWVIHPFREWRLASGNWRQLIVFYHGKPRIAKLPPWDGGFIWTKDSTGKPWIAVACQGLGASAWWPCKDAQWDEPDRGMSLDFDPWLQVISNGRTHPVPDEIIEYSHRPNREPQKVWWTQNPLNTYNATFYIGDYVSWTDTIMGEKGKLDLSFYALRHNEEKARKHFAVVKQMLHCFEYWMGPYPFYEDGYKLVEAPFLGMEHQSAIAYGNEYKMGYRGIDRSATGVGMLFDFIIVHESGHEWFGNNITAKDFADNWIHEGFTTYTEALFAECAFGKEKAFKYTRGEWFNIRNDRPVIGDYGVHDDGSGDKYDKGSAVVHMIRMLMNDDEKFRQMLRKMNETYWHKTVTSAEIEAFIIQFTGLELKPLFDQYLRTANIPAIDWYIQKKRLYYRFKNVVPGFTLPLEVTEGNKKANIRPTADWQSIEWKKGGYNLEFSKDFLVHA
jgi:aminopeptidase N